MNHTTTEHFIKYYPEKLIYAPISRCAQMDNGFILKIRIDRNTVCGKKKQLLAIPGILEINAGTYHFPEAFDELSEYEKCEYYNVYADVNDDSPFLEAVIRLYQSDDDAEGRRCIVLME